MIEEANDIVSPIEEVKGKEKKKKKKASIDGKKRKVSFLDIISGEFLLKDFITSNLQFVSFIIFLGLLLVSKGYYAKQLEQNINKTQKQLDAVTTDYVESKAKLEEETTRGNLLEGLEGSGLKETTNPVKVIRIEKKK
jgi:cell division protein FtsL